LWTKNGTTCVNGSIEEERDFYGSDMSISFEI
jgi:hypothetical protein